jgi:xanthine dehydrogenase accessory factor
MREVLDKLISVLEAGLPCVHCVVVETRGSTPQKAGASMLVFADGSQFGTLGGGCVEAEVRQRALRSLAESAGTEVFSFTLDDDYGWDDGLICGGRMTIATHAMRPDSPKYADATHYYRTLRSFVASGEGCTEAIVISEGDGLYPGDRYVFNGAGQVGAQLAAKPAVDLVVANLIAPSERLAAFAKRGIAYLSTPPRIRLLIVGGGHVGLAVARLASEVDFNIWVLDDRERFADEMRFPMAARRMVGDIGRTLGELAATLTPDTYSLIVTRGHAHDEEALYHLVESSCDYIGMIGSARKIRLIFEDLVAKGVSRDSLSRVHAPLGLPIGSKTVPEIAVSIVAELIACRNLGSSAVSIRGVSHSTPIASRFGGRGHGEGGNSRTGSDTSDRSPSARPDPEVPT